VPRSKKKKPGEGRREQFNTIFCIVQIVLFCFLWIMVTYLEATTTDVIVVYFIGNLVAVVVLRSIDRGAANDALNILGKP
jgi:uncharacterized membrane protein